MKFLLEMEHIEGESDTSGSLMDSVSCGLITACCEWDSLRMTVSVYSFVRSAGTTYKNRAFRLHRNPSSRPGFVTLT